MSDLNYEPEIVFPTPWTTEKRSPGQSWLIRDAWGRPLASVYLDGGTIAPLMAAAPELLAVCEVMLHHAEAVGLGVTLTDTLRVAIAKARGQEVG